MISKLKIIKLLGNDSTKYEASVIVQQIFVLQLVIY